MFFVLLTRFLPDDHREWGWEVFQSIEKYCRIGVGYGTLSTVQNLNGPPRDKMETFFLAETVKYMYLLQDPDTEVDILNKVRKAILQKMNALMHDASLIM